MHEPPTFPRPEDHELQRKLAELAPIEAQLAERELELATAKASLHAFERQVKEALDPRYAELAELQTRLAEIRASRAESEAEPEAPVESPPPRAPTASRPRSAPPPAPPKPAQSTFIVPESLKSLYRTLAKAVHPDLADNDDDRAQRHTFMIRANEAYDAGDERRLLAIYREWESSPEAIRGQGTVPDLIRTIRKIHCCEMRLAQIAVELNALASNSVYALRSMADDAAQYHRDLLNEMCQRLDQQIADARSHLSQLEHTSRS